MGWRFFSSEPGRTVKCTWPSWSTAKTRTTALAWRFPATSIALDVHGRDRVRQRQPAEPDQRHLLCQLVHRDIADSEHRDAVAALAAVDAVVALGVAARHHRVEFAALDRSPGRLAGCLHRLPARLAAGPRDSPTTPPAPPLSGRACSGRLQRRGPVIDVLLVYRVDRLTRSLRDLVTLAW